jgi:hypothetical protein
MDKIAYIKSKLAEIANSDSSNPDPKLHDARLSRKFSLEQELARLQHKESEGKFSIVKKWQASLGREQTAR